MNKNWLMIAAVLGLCAVGLGAVGDHLIRPKLIEWYPNDAEKRVDNWEIAGRYLFYHALAIGLVSVLPSAAFRRGRHLVAGLFLIGIFLFSGCLFAYTLTDIKPLVHFVPIGGVSFMLGWLALILLAAQAPAND